MHGIRDIIIGLKDKTFKRGVLYYNLIDVIVYIMD
jgi:hypothetical protein